MKLSCKFCEDLTQFGWLADLADFGKDARMDGQTHTRMHEVTYRGGIHLKKESKTGLKIVFISPFCLYFQILSFFILSLVLSNPWRCQGLR